MTSSSASSSSTVAQAASRLRALLDRVPPALAATRDPGARPPGSSLWSHAEILGHLIDSALNNIQRFVRLHDHRQLSFPVYDSDQWVAAQRYGQRPWHELISEWTLLNRHVLHLMEQVDPATLEHAWSEGGPATLGFVMVDYVAHLQGHLDDLVPGLSAAPPPV